MGMHTNSLLAAGLAVALAACGSGSDGAGAALREGAFVFPVAGLAYATPSGSGVTDVSGTYRYRDGEAITFSIGGIALGTAPGAPAISPFDLVGATPPASARAVREELQNQLDVTAFDRAANIAFFLASLDADGDPANGVDATGWATTLAEASLRFDVPLLDFPDGAMRRLAARYDIPRTVLLEAPLVALYRALGVQVAAHAPVVSGYDLGADGSDEYVTTRTYDAAGRRVREVQQDADPSTEDETRTTEYDARGRVIRTATRIGARETSRTDHTYDASGQLILQTSTSFDADGNVDDTWAYENGYDTHGNLVSIVQTRSGVRTRTTTYAYDAFGERTAYTILYDGTDRSETYEADVDAEGRTLREVEISINGTSYARDETRFTYDAEGRLSRTVRTEYDDMDEVPEEITETAYTYDAEGATAVSLEDYDADGVVDARSTMRVRPDGRVEETLGEYFDAVTGILVEARRSTTTYDAYGYELTVAVSVDPDGAGPLPFELDSDYVITTTYDAFGNATEQHTLDRVSGDAAVARAAYEPVADGIGYLLWQARTFGAS